MTWRTDKQFHDNRDGNTGHTVFITDRQTVLDWHTVLQTVI